MSKFSFSSLAIVAVLMLPLAMFAQSNPHNSPASPQFDKGWFSFGIGTDFIRTGDIKNWFGASVSANFGRTKFWQVGINLTGPILGSEFLNSIQLGRGFSAVNRWARLSVAGGPSFISGELDYNNDFEYDTFKTIGIFTDAQFMFTPVKEIGLGVQVYGNLNLEHSLTGFRLIMIFEGHK